MPVLTNKLNLPSPVLKAIQASRKKYSKGNADFSVTELAQPPRIRTLKLRHDDEMEEDIGDMIYALQGQIGHALLENAAEESPKFDSVSAIRDIVETDEDEAIDDSEILEKIRRVLNGEAEKEWATQRVVSRDIVEKRFFHKIKVNGKEYVVSGQADLILNPESGQYGLFDWKFSSIFQFKDGIKEDYIAQLNVLSYLIWKSEGIQVHPLCSVPIYRDFSKMRASVTPGYPQRPIDVIEAPVWGHEKTEQYIKDRITLHESCKNLKDDDLPLCTPKERWERGEAYVVIAEGGKRATKSFYCDSAMNAKKLATDLADNLTKASGKKIHPKTKEVTFGAPKKTYLVEHRAGFSTRCREYCSCAPWCSYYQKVVVSQIIAESQKENSQEEE